MLVSVIIPTYNRRRYLCEAIDSVLAQTYPHYEIIVVDDGSTDGTGGVLAARYGDRISYLYQANRGEAAARNLGIRHSRGQYIAFLDSDDLWRPAKLEKQLGLLERRPGVGMVSCHAQRIDAAGNVVTGDTMKSADPRKMLPLETLILNSPLLVSTVIVRRECLDEVGLFWEDTRYGEDRGFCLRVAAVHEVGFVRQPLVLMRRHPGTQTRDLMTQEELEHRLADRLRVNDRLFAFFHRHGKNVAHLKPPAQAAEYAKAAFPTYAAEDYARGAALLGRAVELDPVTWRDGKRVADGVLRSALAVAHAEGREDGFRFVHSFYAHLPRQLQGTGRRCRRRVLARLHITYAFTDYDGGDRASVRANLLKGVAHDPSWLRNAGVLSIATEVLIGPRFAALGRSVCRPFVSKPS